MKDLLDNAPSMQDFLGEDSKKIFNKICETLTAAKIPYQINHRLVRGLDYYCHVVFEWVTEALGAQGTVCAGGRYDGLVEQLGGSATPAVGFAMGIERLVLLLQQNNTAFDSNKADVYIMSSGESERQTALLLTDELRRRFTNRYFVCHCGGGNLKAQFKKADKIGANIALIIGEEELKNYTVTLKYLREEKPQVTVSRDALFKLL
jgi:histidyl-tRNA synthetase